jgi:hypothetical protein
MHHMVRMAASGWLAAGTARLSALASSLARGGALAATTARGGVLALMAPAAALGFASAWHALPVGVVSWDAAADALLGSVRLTGPAAAGIAAWMAIADRRTGLGKLERLAVRSAASRPLGRLGAAAATAVAAYLVIAAGLAGWMIAHGPVAGPVPAAEVLAGAAALLCCVSGGFLAGGLMPSSGPTVLPALAIAVGTYVVTSLSGPAWPSRLQGSGWWRLLVAPALHHPLFTQWRPVLFWAELAWFAGLGCAGMLAFCWTVGRRRRYLGAAVIPLALAVTGASWVHAERQSPVAADTPRLDCQSWPLVICVHPALMRALPQLEPAFTTIASHVAGTPAAVRRLIQYPAGAVSRAGRPRNGNYAFQLGDLAPGYDRTLESGMAAQIVPTCQGPAGQLNEPVRAWLLDTPMPGVDAAAPGPNSAMTQDVTQDVTQDMTQDVTQDTSAVPAAPATAGVPDQIFRGYSEKQRRKWLRHYYHQVVTCKLRPSDFQPTRKGRHRRVP